MRRLWLLLLLGCHHPAAAPPPAPTNSTDVQGDPTVLLHVEQGACMGRCPIYAVDLYTDGAIVFVGQENVVSTGEQRAQLGMGVVDEVRRQFTDARFAEMDDDGNLPQPMDCKTDANGVTTCTGSAVGCSDTSHTVVTYDGKTIDDPHCVDTDLSRLEDRVLPLLQLQRWIGGE